MVMLLNGGCRKVEYFTKIFHVLSSKGKEGHHASCLRQRLKGSGSSNFDRYQLCSFEIDEGPMPSLFCENKSTIRRPS